MHLCTLTVAISIMCVQLKVPQFKPGDIVKVEELSEAMIEVQQQHCQWNDSMAYVIKKIIKLNH